MNSEARAWSIVSFFLCIIVCTGFFNLRACEVQKAQIQADLVQELVAKGYCEVPNVGMSGTRWERCKP